MRYQLLFLASVLALAGCSAQGDTASQQRASIQKMRTETLSKLYSLHPEARADIQHADGYAVFASNSSKILLFGFGSGYGVVKDIRSGKDTYMKMAQGGAGVGMGIKQQRTVVVFHDKAALNNFITRGYVVGADANAAAKYDDKGIAPVGASANGVAKETASLPSKVNVYEMTEKGLAAQAMINGYKYWPDDELNKR
ncbi:MULTISPECIES: YSC84-related protein [Raoultella]|uniref:lipid-binding SYLF domain-containing protein n=1 Tax=Raoultella TaxID=160674 RepID=UPI0021694980|nr:MULTISPECIES: YSC84-related protein [Raoultella]MCS4270543.1 lipid-binding SYLF domain-containing protein [Raoultella sp. BIGb0132]MCS4287503.1 lipid-binding SYLF domain-containing protein [Raoultella terrigena]